MNRWTAVAVCVVLGALIFWFVARNNTGSTHTGVRIIEKSVVRDTVYSIKYQTIEKVKPVFTVDTVEVFVVSSDTTSMENRAPVFTASLDTVMFDSSLSLGIRYRSPSPLDAESFFEIDARLKERKVREVETVYIEVEPDILSKWLHFGLVIAPGYGILNKQTDIFIGMGVMIGL
ncbi:MAG: hypothetical protein LCH52_09985 [Bacteroidetes bacterium]|nr:hypothetical protein [Bacteroidota bacterium]